MPFIEMTFIGIGLTCDKCGFEPINKSFSEDLTVTHIDCPKCGDKEVIDLNDINKKDE